MSLIAIQCKNCGGNLQIDSNSQNYFCYHCGSSFAMEETVINNITNNSTTIGHVENLIDDGSGKIDQKICGAEQLLAFGRYTTARELFEELTYHYAHKYRAWWGLIRAKTEDFTRTPAGRSEYEEICGLFDNLLKFPSAPAQERYVWEEQYSDYRNRGQMILDALANERTDKLFSIEAREANELLPKREQQLKLLDRILKKESQTETVNRLSKIVPFVAGGAVAGLTALLTLVSGDLMEMSSLIGILLTGGIGFTVVKVPMLMVCKAITGVTHGVIMNLRAKEAVLQEAISNIESAFRSEKDMVYAETCWLDC